MSDSSVYVVQMTSGEVVIGLAEGEVDVTDSVHLAYPITLAPVMTQGPDGQPQQQMSINPYFPFGEYKASEGLRIDAAHYVHAMPAVEGLVQAHTNYVNQLRASENGLVVAGANDLPENKFGVDPSEMTNGGLRIAED